MILMRQLRKQESRGSGFTYDMNVRKPEYYRGSTLI